MAKVSKIKLHLYTEFGEYYEIHYNAKNAPLFSVKGLPEDFTRITGQYAHGFKTEEDLFSEIHKAVRKYKDLKISQRKVIVYKASATPELTMFRKEGFYDSGYEGVLPGVSKRLDSFGFGAETASFGISYKVMVEVDHVNTKKYHLVLNDGSLGHPKSLSLKEQVIPWTVEGEDFFKNIYNSMREMVLKISSFVDQNPEDLSLLFENTKKLLL